CPPKFFRQLDLSNHPQTMPPTFLFLLYKIFKEQTISKTVENLNPQSTQATTPKPIKPSGHQSLNSLSHPTQRCRVSSPHRSVCQPIFLKKITNLIAVLFSRH